jgi:predicted dehydrogenase
MLLSKCSHDLDIMAWLMNDTRPSRVSSIGSVFQFRPELAPEGAGTHCLLNCPVERDCIYSARRLYLEHPQRWANNVWRECGHAGCSEEEKQRILLEKDNPYSRCVYRCDLQIVDHQSVLVGFADGATGTFSMTGGAAAPARHIHITGTRGELSGIFEEKRFTVSRIDPEAEGGMVRRVVDAPVALSWDAHGGGDQAVVQDFIALLTGTGVSPCCTTLEDSMAGHQIVFLAEKSREKNGETQYL